jgi:hypothetical protein
MGVTEDDQNRLELSWGNLQKSKTEFEHARDGDHLMVPFECDICIFQKLRNEEYPNLNSYKDRLLMACIRRANLDSFWSRATSSVTANRDRARLALELSESVGLTGPYEHTASLPNFDHCGYEIAIQMLLDSRRPGKHSKEYMQWDTIRKIRTTFSNHARASPQANLVTTALGDERGQVQRLVSDKCSSYWFSKFFLGCKRRMGQDWRPNKAMGILLIQSIVKAVAETIETANSENTRHDWIVFGTYFVVSYVLSLRGVEGLLLDLKGTIDHIHKSDNTYFIIALLGKVKGEHHHRCHLLPCCTKTSSDIQVKDWVLLLLHEKGRLGFQDRPAISDVHGKAQSCGQLDELFIEVLEEMYDANNTLFPPSISVKDEVAISYSVFRSLRRSSNTRALENNVSSTDIALVNRWHLVEKSQGGKSALPMYQHYAQIELLVEPFKRYTKAM